LPAFVARSWEDARRGSRAGLLNQDCFSTWYVGFLAFIEKCKRAQQQQVDAGLASDAHSLHNPFVGDGLWMVPMASLQDALEASWAKGRTPLLIDSTSDGGESTPLETYYAYSGDRCLDMKRAVVEVDVKKEKTLDEVLAEMRAKLVLSMRRGYHVVYMLGNAAPRLRSRFSSARHLPFVLLADNGEVQRVLGR